MRQLLAQDCQLLIHIRVVNVQIGAPAAQRLGQRPCPVGGQHHKGNGFCPDGADFRHGHLLLGQQLQQEGFKFLIRLVHLVNQQHHRLLSADGFQQRAFQQVFLGEQAVHQLLPLLGIPVHLNGKQLLLVVPFIQRLAFIQSLIAL